MNRREFLAGCSGVVLLLPGQVYGQLSPAATSSWLPPGSVDEPVNLARCGTLRSWISPGADLPGTQNSLRVSALSWKQSEADIGIEWPEFRTITEVVVQFSGEPNGGLVYLEYWKGLTALQGAWQTFERGTTNGIHLDIERGLWRFSFAPHRTCKVRLRFRNGARNAVVTRLSVHGPSIWKKGEISLEWGHLQVAPLQGHLETYNAEFVTVRPLKTASIRDSYGWNSAQGSQAGLAISLLYTSGLDVDRSVLTLRTPTGGVSLLPAEAIAEGAIDIPDFGLYVRRADFQADWKSYHAMNRGKLRIIDAVQELPEQTYDGAYSHIKARRVTLTFVGAEASNQKFGIAPDGHFVIGNNDPLAGDPIEPSFAIYFDSAEQPFFFEQPPPPTGIYQKHASDVPVVPKEQSLEDGWLPVVMTKWSHNELLFERTDFGAYASGSQASDDKLGNEPAILSSELRIRNTAPVPKRATYFIRPWKPAESKRFTYGPLPLEAVEAWTISLRGQFVTTSDGEKERVLCRLDWHGRGVCAFDPQHNAIRYQIDLNPGEEHRFHTFVAGWLPDPQNSALLNHADYDKLHTATIEHWRMRRSQSMRIEIPDKQLQNVFDASLQHFLLVLTKNGSKREYYPNTAMFLYGSIGSESNPVIQALDLRGLPQFAQASLQAFLSTQNEFAPEGDYVSKEGGYYRFWPLYTIDQGGVLCALAEHYFLTGDREWLGRAAPQIIAGCDFLIRERTRTKRLNPDGSKPLHYGFAPAGCAADPRDWQYSFILNAWFYAGLHGAALALQDIEVEAAKRISAEAEDYRACILHAVRESWMRSPVTRLRDNTSVPSMPPYLGPRGFSTELKDSVDPDLRHGYAYDCTIGPFHLFNCGVLEPDDRLVSWMLHYLEDRFFLFTPLPSRINLDDISTDWFNLGGFEKLQPYYVHYPQAYLRRNQIPNFLRGFYNTLASISDPQTLTFQEELDFGGGQPHKTHEEAWFFQQMRNMLVMESGTELHLAAGTPRRWLNDGGGLTVDRAPTHFGKVSYRIKPSLKEGRIHGSVQPPDQRHPSRLLIRLRHPSQQPIKRVVVNGQNWTEVDNVKERIVLPATREKIEFTVFY